MIEIIAQMRMYSMIPLKRFERLELKFGSVAHWYIPDVYTSLLPAKRRNTIGSRFDRHWKFALSFNFNWIGAEDEEDGRYIKEEEKKRIGRRRECTLCPTTVQRIINTHTGKGLLRRVLAHPRSHLVGFSHEYITKDRWRSKTVTPSENHPLSNHFPPTWGWLPSRDRFGTDAHAILPKKSLKSSFSTTRTRSPREFHKILTDLSFTLHRRDKSIPYHQTAIACTHVCLGVRWSLWVCDPIDDAYWTIISGCYIRMFLSIIFFFFSSSVLIERGKRKVERKRNKAGGVARRSRRDALTLESRSVGETRGGSQYKRVQRDPGV